MSEQSVLEALLADAQRAQDRGDFHELRTIAQEAVSAATASGDDRALSLAWFFLGFAEMQIGAASRAEEAFECSLELASRIGARIEAARAKMNLGVLAFETRFDVPAARRIYEEVIAEFEQLERPLGLAVALAHSTEVCRAVGDYSQALKRGARAIELFEQTGNAWRAAMQRVTNAHVLALVRRNDEAVAQMQLAFEPIRASGNPSSLAAYFEVWSLVAVALEQFSAAAELTGFVDTMRHRDDVRPSIRLMTWVANAQQKIRGTLGIDAYDMAYYIGAHASLDAMRDRVGRLATSAAT